jgi:transposase, IS6 family
MIGDHHGRSARRATLLVRAVDAILGTHTRRRRGLKRHRPARILAAGHAYVQTLRRGHYELATDVPACHRIREAFNQLAMAI